LEPVLAQGPVSRLTVNNPNSKCTVVEGLTVSKTVKGISHNYIDYNSLRMQFGTTVHILYTRIDVDCILNGLPWRRFALSQCF